MSNPIPEPYLTPRGPNASHVIGCPLITPGGYCACPTLVAVGSAGRSSLKIQAPNCPTSTGTPAGSRTQRQNGNVRDEEPESCARTGLIASLICRRHASSTPSMGRRTAT